MTKRYDANRSKMWMLDARTGHNKRVNSLPAAPQRMFVSDNAAGAHPLVLEALNRANAGHALAYGQDAYTARAEAKFCELFGADVVTKFVYGGTGANVLALANMLRPAEAVVCTSWSHIHVDETGAPERILGAKLIDVASTDAKLRPDDLRSLAYLMGSHHHAQPAVVSLTQATELGTLYTPTEVREVCDTAHEMGMLVHMDGARIANATAALGGTVAALRSFTIDAGVDVLSFGGTKAGAVFGEAVVFLNTSIGGRTDYIRKQVTQLHSKMRFISAQYEALLTDNLFIDLGARSNSAATNLFEATRTIESLNLVLPPQVNSLFPTIQDPEKTELQRWSFFWDWDTALHQVRWMTAWDIEQNDVDTFVSGLKALID